MRQILVGPIVIKALLAEIGSLDIDIHSGAVADILPLTQFQEDDVVVDIKYPQQFCSYLYLDLDVGLGILCLI